MSETWYEAYAVFNSIKPVEVERSTEKSIWIDGRRCDKLTWKAYFPTWDAARDYLLKQATESVEAARLSLERAHAKLGNVKGMKPPASSDINQSAEDKA